MIATTKYPINWEKVDKEELFPFVGHIPPNSETKTLVMFRNPQENSKDTSREVVSIVRTDPS